jgi:hypothetical protein
MKKRLVDLRWHEQPLLDMPHAAYRAACRPRYYAEVERSISSWWAPFTVAWERFAYRCARVIRHRFASSQRAEELQQPIVCPESTGLDPIWDRSGQRSLLQSQESMHVDLRGVDRIQAVCDKPVALSMLRLRQIPMHLRDCPTVRASLHTRTCIMTVVPIPAHKLKGDTWYYGVRCACMRIHALCEDLFGAQSNDPELHCPIPVTVTCECGRVTNAERLYKYKTPPG